MSVSALGHGGRGQAESEPGGRDGPADMLELHCVGGGRGESGNILSPLLPGMMQSLIKKKIDDVRISYW